MKHDNVDSGIRTLRRAWCCVPGLDALPAGNIFTDGQVRKKKLRKIQVHFKLTTASLKRANMSEIQISQINGEA